MKRIVFTFLVILLLVFCAIPVNAADYTIEELQITLTTPANWTTFIKGLEPQQEDLDLMEIDLETISDYFENNDIYLLTLSNDGVSQMMLTEYTGPALTTVFMAVDYSDKALANEVEEFVEECKINDPDVTYAGWDFFTSDNQIDYLILHYWYIIDDQYVYCQQYITTHNGKSLDLTLRSFGSEITEEHAAVQKMLANSISFVEKATITPEDLGRITARILIDIVVACLIITFIWNKLSNKLKKKRTQRADLENGAMEDQNEKGDTVKEAKRELHIYFTLGFVYFITVYFFLFLSILSYGGNMLRVVCLGGYGFYSLIKNRKESINIIDHILIDAYPEKKRIYHILINTFMILFLFLLCLPLLFAVCFLSFLTYSAIMVMA